MLVMIPTNLVPLLKEVMTKRCPDYLHLIAEGNRLELSEEQRQRLENSLASEFVAALDSDEEPTLRGRQLDDLISAIARRQ